MKSKHDTIDNLEAYLAQLDRYIRAQAANDPLHHIPTFAEFQLEGISKEMARNHGKRALMREGLEVELK